MEIQVELRLRVSLCVVGGAPHYVKLKYITNPATPKWILLAGWQRKVSYKNWKEKKNKRIMQGCPTGVCHAKLTPKNGDKYWTFMKSDLPSSLDTQKCSTVFFSLELRTWHVSAPALTCNDDPVREANAEKIGSGGGSCGFTVCANCRAGCVLSTVTTPAFAGLCTAHCHGNASRACLLLLLRFSLVPVCGILLLWSIAKRHAGHKRSPFSIG